VRSLARTHFVELRGKINLSGCQEDKLKDKRRRTRKKNIIYILVCLSSVVNVCRARCFSTVSQQNRKQLWTLLHRGPLKLTRREKLSGISHQDLAHTCVCVCVCIYMAIRIPFEIFHLPLRFIYFSAVQVDVFRQEYVI